MLHVKPEPTPLCEAALIERVKSGDQGAYTTLYELHIKRVYGLCLRLLADQAHAEDAAQEVFVQVWHKIALFDGRSQFSTWLYSVASNVAINSEIGEIKRMFVDPTFRRIGAGRAILEGLLIESKKTGYKK